MKDWNMCIEPIATRLRDEDELQLVQETNAMIYLEETKETALIMDVWIVEPVPGQDDTLVEDRYIRYTTEHEVREDYSVDLDSEGWLWYDSLTLETQ